MVVAVEKRSSRLELGAPSPLFSTANLVPHDASPDGERFLAVQHPERAAVAEIRVVLNWADTITGVGEE